MGVRITCRCWWRLVVHGDGLVGIAGLTTIDGHRLSPFVRYVLDTPANRVRLSRIANGLNRGPIHQTGDIQTAGRGRGSKSGPVSRPRPWE